MNNSHKTKISFNQSLSVICFIAVAVILLSPENCFANDAFANIHNKIKIWVNGSLGKLITFVAFIATAIMGVAGYPIKAILGVAMLGLTLASADALVDMLFM